MSQGKYTLQIRDYNEETAGTELNIGTITALNLVSRLGDVDDFKAAVEGVTLGVLAADSFMVSSGPLSGAVPNDKNAQVEDKWRVFYYDSTQFLDAPVNAIPNPGWNKSFHNDIPTPDRSLLMTHSDLLDINTIATPGASLKGAFEQLVRSPYSGVPVVTHVQYV